MSYSNGRTFVEILNRPGPVIIVFTFTISFVGLVMFGDPEKALDWLPVLQGLGTLLMGAVGWLIYRQGRATTEAVESVRGSSEQTQRDVRQLEENTNHKMDETILAVRAEARSAGRFEALAEMMPMIEEAVLKAQKAANLTAEATAAGVAAAGQAERAGTEILKDTLDD